MGTICVSVGISMGMDPVLLGGAMLSGVYFGDRCSPASSSATLVAAATDTKLYDNLTSTMSHADSLVIDLKAHPKRYVHFSIFGKKDK